MTIACLIVILAAVIAYFVIVDICEREPIDAHTRQHRTGKPCPWCKAARVDDQLADLDRRITEAKRKDRDALIEALDLDRRGGAA